MKISELAKVTGIQIETIRYYEREGLLPEITRTESNYRIYNETHTKRLLFIRHCRSLDMMLSEIRTLLSFKDTPTKNCGEVNALLDEHINHVTARIQELRSLEQQLKRLRKLCQETQEAAHCGILNELACPNPKSDTSSNTMHVHGTHKGGRHSGEHKTMKNKKK